MTQCNSNVIDGTPSRLLCWDEENRLMAVHDHEFLSDYIYDAGGERVWKFSGDIQQMTINGDQLINMANITDKTLYTSPYLVANDNNYTKHYFIESERVCSKIGGGFSTLLDPVNQAIIEPINSDQLTISSNFTQHVINSISCTNIESPELNVEPMLHGIEDFINIDENENLQYFSVSDHLGSSSFITDAGGEAVQHLQYLPFGEHFVSQTSSSWQTRYTFSGKEKDVETGYSYFGARYYDSEESIWLSVDALSDKYLSTSPYMYVLGNPIGIIDPNGDSSFVLTAPKGAGGAGHMAMLIQNKEGRWALWSKNGTNESSGSSGANDKGDDNGEKAYDSPQAFLDSKDNLTKEGNKEYTEGYVIAATASQDRKMEAGFESELKKEYNVATSNCATAVQSALTNAGFESGKYNGSILYNPMIRGSAILEIIIRKSPSIIYSRIKLQNPEGEVLKVKPPSIKTAYIPRKTKHI